ncbi:TPA: ead/Ea22-like family protein [Escherichia coli]|uniref:ead/Ea22-like family protein n=1 Tax=Escherichia coli TaxID=562 RepID=UPI001987F9DF|nr:ead/Ea22-like family protein [Escherichia coli]HCB3209172.1 ead/Ea22-like family protein [Escherichia coli]HCB3224505.1 ead/Ea22-like family protein [Escherichia coli]HDQ2942869.1 ead/Ea22-like family protein [Escherichia coli]
MTALNKQALRSKARSASAGEWIKESGDGWEAICSADDQANGNFIIAHFEGPDAQANREFVQAANPDAVLALLDELEAAEKRIAKLEARQIVLPRTQDVHPLGPQSAKIFCDFHRNIINRCADEIRKVGVNVSINGE